METSVKSGQFSPKRAFISGAIGIIALLFLTALYALWRSRQMQPASGDKIFMRIALIISSFIASYTACAGQKSNNIPTVAFGAAVIFVFLMLLGLLSDKSVLNISQLGNLLCIILGASTGCLLTLKTKRTSRRFGYNRKRRRA